MFRYGARVYRGGHMDLPGRGNKINFIGILGADVGKNEGIVCGDSLEVDSEIKFSKF